jgi:flagellar secretion chaperone FliS
MAYQSYSGYTENEVIHASPEKLVQILYELGIKSLTAARECGQSKDISGRVRHINKAFDVVTELMSGLDFEAGGDIANNYARIYDYCQRRLIEANAKQSDAILAEIQGLIEDLNEAWQGVVNKVSAERTAKLMSPEILPSEQSMAGELSYVG